MRASWARRVGVAWVCVACAAGCVELDPLDPDKPFPGDLPTDGQPPPNCGLASLEMGDAALYLHVIDVGQGDALLIQTPDDGEDGNGVAEGLNILIDAGNLGTSGLTDGGEYVARYLGRLGVRQLDWAIVSHAHADHYGGMTEVFDAVAVRNIVDPGYDADNSSWPRFLSAAAEEVQGSGGRHLRPAVGAWVQQVGDTVDWGSELEVRVLNAREGATLGDADNSRVNNTSIVLHIQYNDVGLLLMGDAEEEVEEELVASGMNLRANILKVGHHGSSSSSTKEFLEAVFGGVNATERWGAISSGRVNFSGVYLPTVSTRSRLREEMPSNQLFSTVFGDDEKMEEEAAGDDDIVFVVAPDGSIGACYLY